MEKRILGAVLGLALAISGAVRAETTAEAGQWKNAVSINLPSLAVGLMSAQYEMRLTPGSSLPVRLYYVSVGGDESSFTGLGAGAAYRMYFGQKALEGFYFAPTFDALMLTLKVTEAVTKLEAKATGTLFGPGVELGKQWIWNSGFLIDFGLNGTYYIGNVEAKAGNQSAKVSFAGFVPGLRLAIGLAF